MPRWGSRVIPAQLFAAPLFFHASWGQVRYPNSPVRNGVKRPAQLATSNVEGTNVTRGRGESLGIAAADDHQIFVNDRWAGQGNRLSGGRFAAKIFAEVDAAFFRKRWDRPASRDVQSVEEIHHAHKNALVVAVGPIGQTAIWLRASNSRVELPKELAGRGIQRENLLRRRDSIKDSRDDNGAGLKAAFFLRVEAPCNGKALDVAAIDLGEAGIVIVLRRAAICRPVLMFFDARSVLWPRACRPGDKRRLGDNQGGS